MVKKALIKKIDDNVATVLENVNKGEIIKIVYGSNEVIEKIEALDNIPFGNKIAFLNIKMEEFILKGGYKIGIATKDIIKGEFVHIQNVRSQVVDFPDSIQLEIKRQMEINE